MKHYALTLLTVFLTWLTLSGPGASINIEVRVPLSQEVLSNNLVSGNIDLGNLDPFGLNQDASAVADGVFTLNNQQIIQAISSSVLPASSLYVLGTPKGRAAIEVSVSDLGAESVELYASYTGDLTLYLASPDADWLPGASLNSANFVEMPSQGALIPLRGVGGLISEASLTPTDSLQGFDMAFQVPLNELAGPKSGVLTFTLIPQ